MLKTVSWPATERDEELWGWDGWEESRGGGRFLTTGRVGGALGDDAASSFFT